MRYLTITPNGALQLITSSGGIGFNYFRVESTLLIEPGRIMQSPQVEILGIGNIEIEGAMEIR
jgi:hypothetical protein